MKTQFRNDDRWEIIFFYLLLLDFLCTYNKWCVNESKFTVCVPAKRVSKATVCDHGSVYDSRDERDSNYYPYYYYYTLWYSVVPDTRTRLL